MKEIVIKVVLTVLTLAISYVLFKQVYKWLLKLILKFNKEFRMQNTLKLILGIVISIFVLFIVLDIWDVSLLPLITGLGIGGIVAGFALQEPLSNLVAGIFLLSSGTVKEGEVLDIGGTAGTVEAVYLNHTLIKTFDGKRVYIPNKIVWNERITHYWPGPVRRVSLIVGVSYDSDLKKVIEVLERALKDEEMVEKDPEPSIIFKGFGSSSIDFELRFWVKRENYFPAQNALGLRVKKYFDEEGIEIPFQQVDVHLKGDSDESVENKN